jgi:hypothetical protein
VVSKRAAGNACSDEPGGGCRADPGFCALKQSMAFLFRMDYTGNRQQVERPWLNHRRITGAFLLSASPKWPFHFRPANRRISTRLFLLTTRGTPTLLPMGDAPAQTVLSQPIALLK